MELQVRAQPSTVAGAERARAVEALAALHNIPFPMAVIELERSRVLAVNGPLAALLGVEATALAGRPWADLIEVGGRATERLGLESLRNGRLDGFESRHRYTPVDGVAFAARAWLRRLDGAPTLALVVLIADDVAGGHAAGGREVTSDTLPLLMAVTDHEWLIDNVSAGAAGVVGVDAPDLLGRPLLGLVHPGDASEFLFAATRATTTKEAVVCRVRLGIPGRPAQDTVCFVTALCDHSPPRLGLVVTVPEEGERPNKPRATELEQVLRRIGAEVRSAGFVGELPAPLGKFRSAELAQLSSRKWEIINRLVQGETAPTIAAAMYLSPSTVRNHLATVYRKFGVHSQLELVSLLRGWTPPSGSDSVRVPDVHGE